MPGTMIALALLLAPAMDPGLDSGLKDPWSDGARAVTPAPSGELKNPFEGKHPPPPTDRDSGLVDPFRARTGERVDPSTRARSLELQNPFAPRPAARRSIKK